MQEAGLCAKELQRLQRLHALNLLDSIHEARLDRCTRVASRHFDTPICAISLIDAKRQ